MNYLQTLTLAAGLLASTAATAQEPAPVSPVAQGQVQQVQYHHGHWDVYYLDVFGHEHFWQSYYTHAEADYAIWYLHQVYHVHAYHRYHYH